MSSGATMLGAGAMLAGSRASLLSGDGATSLLSDGVDGSELGAELSATSAGSVSVAGAAAVESSMLRTSSVGKSLGGVGGICGVATVLCPVRTITERVKLNPRPTGCPTSTCPRSVTTSEVFV